MCKGLNPRRCETFRAKTHLCENFLSQRFPQQRKNSPKHKHLIGFAILLSKTQAFDWIRYFHFATEQKRIQLPGEEKYFAEKHSKIMLRMRSIFSREIFRISLVVELGLINSAINQFTAHPNNGFCILRDKLQLTGSIEMCMSKPFMAEFWNRICTNVPTEQTMRLSTTAINNVKTEKQV